MAYAFLVSLTQTLSQIMKHHQHGVFLDEKQRLESLHTHLEFLQAFLEGFPEKANDLEGGIRDAVSQAEDIIEYLLFEEIRSLNSSGSSLKVADQKRENTKKDAMVGLKEDVLAMKSRLCGESRKLEFIPIYGMGGIGKTILARSAYDDSLITEHFHIRAWVTVSQDYSIQEMLFTLVDSIRAFSEKFDEEKIAMNKWQNMCTKI
ncbi:UNVERIFIED_CONTAM: Disease resistance protein RPP13 [Sesamum latifolium]|uniref:Disease resistance protein RPP13 n=1 Tax=Sesamum latifolium TaxID=2727402 RepID=A0AAW2TCY0_9LAMI